MCLLSCKMDRFKNIVYPVLHLETVFYSDDRSYDEDSLQLIYGDFWQDYKQGILYIPESEDFNFVVNEMKLNENIKSALSLMQDNYQNFNNYSLKLNDAIINYTEFFPAKKVPRIVTYFGAFNFPIAVNQNTLGIGLEMFLGSSFYKDLSYKYPPYMHHQFSSEYLVCTAMDEWLKSEFSFNKGSFLANIIHQGKIKYILTRILDEEEHIIMRFTEEQLNWCELSEFSIWSFLISKGLLYSNDRFEIEKFINPAPSSRGMPEESPGQAVNWIGFKIVEKFMQNNPDLTLEELMQIQDAQYILQKSKYRAK